MSEEDLPEGWRTVELGTVADLVLGKMLDRAKHSASRGRSLPYLRNINVRWGSIETGDVQTMPFDDDELDRYGLRRGDLLVCEGGEPGRCAIWDGADPHMKFQKALHRVRPRADLEPAFLRYRLEADAKAGRLDDYFTGTTIKHLTGSSLSRFTFGLPPLDEQRGIVAKLDALRACSRRAKDALDAVPVLLDRLRQSILAAAFRGDLTADWREQNPDVEPASELLKRIRIERRKRWEDAELAKLIAKGKRPKDDAWKAKYVEPEPVDESDLPDLPDGWCWASVDDLSELQLGQQRDPVHAAAERTYPYIRAANITWTGLDLSDVKEMGFPDPARYLLRPGDVLLSEASGSASEVGKPVIWRGEIAECCYQKTLLRARPVSTDANSEWLHLCFFADAVMGRFARMAPGVGILHLTAERMRSWPVPIAPVEEQRRIASLTRDALRASESLGSKGRDVRKRLDEGDNAILAAAFRGELLAGQD